ncbi:mechanosensitive ion channel family protein [Taibaiella soli]|uniref:Mechanosensitive ion channel protein n=1 Tax=Taibaiella soli TaxID=1649169 RepID=A0A2W2AGE9_9BACT|nr:mechanosensitive ion channel domain-containing protein [Taibaiella soli]PZF74341.1 hypothetical protein DN068_01810 [Taibaiella soli]
MIKLKYILALLALFFVLHAEAQNRQDSVQITESDQAATSTDTLLKKVERMHTSLNRINNVSERGFDTRDIEKNLPQIQENLAIIQENLSQYSSVQNARNLQLYSVLVSDMQAQMNDWRTALFAYNRQVISMNEQIRSFVDDSMIQHIRKDTLFFHLYQSELSDIKSKWEKAIRSTASDLDKITKLQASVSNTYFASIELKNTIRRQIKKSQTETFGQEYPFIWEKEQANAAASVDQAKVYEGQRKIVRYYFQRNGSDWWWFLIIGLMFFGWVANNFRAVKKAGGLSIAEQPELTYVSAFPLAAASVVVFNIAPFFDLNPPSVYVNMMQFLLLIGLSFVLWRSWQRKFFWYWLAIVAFYLFFAFSNVVTHISPAYRWLLLAVNAGCVVFGLSLLRLLRTELAMKGFTKTVTGIFIVLNIAAIVANIAGRVSMAKVMSIAGIFGLSQVIGLSVFIHLIDEAFYLQMVKSRLKDGKNIRFNYGKIQDRLNKILSFVAVIAWVIIFASNLNAYNQLYKKLYFFLNKPYEVGSVSFTAGHILLFFVVLYISNLLQQYLGYFLGETEDDFGSETNKKNSRLAIVKLVLLLGGFLLAMTASGLPVDKLTVVLGAVGVGVGLGLQNIVNNLVSGVILIFEKPLQLGDYIELGDKKGKVKTIGIRASKMLTSEGAEVIVPNGDLISNRLTNWTLSNEHIRTVLTYKLQPIAQLEEAKQCILDVLANTERVMQQLPAEILITNINDTSVELSVRFWLTNLNQEHEVKSEVLVNVYNALKSRGINLL